MQEGAFLFKSFFCNAALILVAAQFSAIAQEESVSASLVNNIIIVRDGDSLIFTSHHFTDAKEEWTDFDNDGIDEMSIIDKKNDANYYIYIFLLIDKLQLADSLYCGVTEPFIGYSDELLEPVIYSAYPELEQFFSNKEDVISAVCCYQFDGEKFTKINDRLYSVFMEANENLFLILEKHFINSNKDCGLAMQHKGLLASIYINYQNASENSLANGFIEKYYPCDDRIAFTEFLNSIR